MNVAVTVITCGRPEGLARLLAALNELTFEGEVPSVRIVVVDNDSDGGARRICEEAKSQSKWAIEYHIEPRRGIPFARNKAVACAKDNADFVAFIDDDEVPERGWLDELLRVQRDCDADVVTGPVLTEFAVPPPPWVMEGKFFDSKRWPTGERVDRAFTNNVMFRTDIFQNMNPPFDERLAMSGGSDTHFGRRLHLAGYKIVWADEALVCETVPPSRVCARWILQRAYRVGIMTAFIDLDILPRWIAAGRILRGGIARVLRGVLLLLPACLLGKRWIVESTRLMSYGSGMLLGLFGVRYAEYRRIHGS